MADINQLISLGIGTPSDIEHFILVGLNTAVIGIVPVGLHERYLAAGTLFDRSFASADLYERLFGVATLEDKP